MKSNGKKSRELVANDLPIAAGDLLRADNASRASSLRMQRDGMPVTRIGRRTFVRINGIIRVGSDHP
jgi:hypothetical protein